MRYNPNTRTLTLERKDCVVCWTQDPQGTMPAKVPCPTCHGTGKGPRGGARGCRDCSGFGHRWDHDQRVTCPNCLGLYERFDSEIRTDRAPAEALADVDLQIVYVDRAQTWDEAYLGLGALVSVTDYGRSYDASDPEALATEVRERFLTEHHQAIKIAAFPREAEAGYSAPVADTIVVVVTRGGYVLVPFLEGEPLRY